MTCAQGNLDCLWRYLGGFSDVVKPLGSNRGEVQARLKEAQNMAEQHGFKAFKVKVGLNLKDDVAFVKALREQLGQNIILQTDANGASSLLEAPKAVEIFAREEILLFKDPCALPLSKSSENFLASLPCP